MLPFIIKGKVPLGFRRDYNLSESGLRERIEERLVSSDRRSEGRRDGSPAGDSRGLVAGGISRLKNMGLLTAVQVRRVKVFSRDERLFAAYELDATVTTLVSLVVIPLVLGSVLFSHSSFSFYEALAIIILLMLTSWGLDVFILVMLLRHEISQIASEIRTILRNRDTLSVDAHHTDLAPEELLATAYYYERNGFVRRCEAYLAHLGLHHPDSLEAALARDHMEHLEGRPRQAARARTREGEKRDTPALRPDGPAPGKKRRLLSSRKTARGEAPLRKGERRWRRRWLPWFGRNREAAGDPARPQSPPVPGTKTRRGRSRFFSTRRRSRAPETKDLRRRRERLARRDTLATSPRERSLPLFKRLKLFLSRIFRQESRSERSYRRKHERWIHGPGSRTPAEKADGAGGTSRVSRPNWMKSREEKQAHLRLRRWSGGQAGPGAIQKERDRFGRWRLLRRRSSQDRLMEERRQRAAGEPPYAAG